MADKRVLMFTMGHWSHSNAAILSALRLNRPQWEIRQVDLVQELRRDKRILLACGLDLPLLAWQALQDQAFDRNNCLYAPATSRFINRLASAVARDWRPDFTLQTTTRFNAATPGVPHFTVVDVTLAAARWYYRDVRQASPRALDMLHHFQQRVFDQSAGVFAMGRYVRDSLVRDYGVEAARAFAIGAGPNIPVGPAADPAASRDILFVGTNWVRKGGPSLLAAFRKLREHAPEARLVIVGCSPQVDEPGVEVVGRVAPAELPRYFGAARVFAMPSEFEAFGIVYVEALHHGLPIVGPAVCAVPEMVEEGANGYLVAPGDVQALADRLLMLFSSDALVRRYGEASRQKARQYSWERAGQALADGMLELSGKMSSDARPVRPQTTPVSETA